MFKPSRKWIDGLKVGDIAPDCFGSDAVVVKIIHAGINCQGKAYIGVALKYGKYNSKITQTYVEGQLHRTVKLTNQYNSKELDEIEKQIPESDIYTEEPPEEVF